MPFCRLLGQRGLEILKSEDKSLGHIKDKWVKSLYSRDKGDIYSLLDIVANIVACVLLGFN